MLIMTLGFDPYLSAMHFNDSLGDGKSETGPFCLECDFTGAVLFNISDFIKLVENRSWSSRSMPIPVSVIVTSTYIW